MLGFSISCECLCCAICIVGNFYVIDHVIILMSRKKSTRESGYTLVQDREARSGCYRAIGPDVVKELVVPLADRALADFNSKHVIAFDLFFFYTYVPTYIHIYIHTFREHI